VAKMSVRWLAVFGVLVVILVVALVVLGQLFAF
jgi:hypothetical protein